MQNKRLLLVYLSGFLMSVHFASVSYINSSLLNQHVGSGVISSLYIIASVLTIIFLFAVPHFLRKFGSVGIFVFFVTLEIFATLGLGMVSLVGLVIFFFIVHLSADPVLYLCLDVNLEQEIKQEGTTGLKRSILLTVSNAAWVISPLALVFLINGNFSKVYLLSGIVLIPLLFIIIFFFKNTKRANEAGDLSGFLPE